MPTLQSLPAELVLSIFEQLDNIRHLPSVLRTCRHYYELYKKTPSIARNILQQQQIHPDILPYAVAAFQANSLPRRSTKKAEAARAILRGVDDENNNNPDQLKAKLNAMPLPSLMRMGRTHDVMMIMAADMADDAWSVLCEDLGISETCDLRPRERVWFLKAFYRTELFFASFRGDFSEISESQIHPMLAKYKVWEVEQIVSVLDFLEKRFYNATVDIISHDVEFGALNVDYVSFGNDNDDVQSWLSQGVEYVHKVINEPSYWGKRGLLMDSFYADGCNLYDGVLGYRDTLPSWWEDSNHHPLDRPDAQGEDEGPQMGISALGSDWDWTAGIAMFGLRERAYVFWESERLLRLNLLTHFPRGCTSNWRNKMGLWPGQQPDLEAEMLESFEARAKLHFEMGGWGHWMPGDDSDEDTNIRGHGRPLPSP